MLRPYQQDRSTARFDPAKLVSQRHHRMNRAQQNQRQ